MKRDSRLRPLALLLLCLAMFAAACGSSDSEAGETSSSTSDTTEESSSTSESDAESDSESGSSDAAVSSGGERIAVITPDYSAQPAAKEALDLFLAEAEGRGYDVSLVDTNSDNAAINAELTTAVAQNVDAIVLGFGTPLEFGEGLANASDAGVPVFGLAVGGRVDGILINTETENAELGEITAQQIIDRIGEGGKVAMIHFDPFEPVRQRAESATALFEASGVEIIEYVQGDPADSTGFAAATSGDWLTKYPEGEIDAIWAGWDASALGAYQATQDTGRTEVLVTGVDGLDFAQAEVAKDGNWIATVATDWPLFATTLNDLLDDYFDGNAPTEEVIFIESILITADNATAGPDAGSSDEAATSTEAATIAVLSPDYANQPAAKEAIDLFVAEAEGRGHAVSVVDTNSDNAAMNAEITTAVAQGVDAIVVGFGTPQEFGEGLADAVDAGIPVFGLDTGGLVDGILVNVTTDNAVLGGQSAQAIIDQIGPDGTVAMIHFDPFEPVRLRAEAASVLFEEAGIEVIEYVQGDPADSTGFAAATAGDWLTKYPEGYIDAIWAGWDASALGAYQATQDTGRTEVLVTGVDGQDFAQAEVAKDGNWIATVRQDWPTIATTVADLIEAQLGGSAPTEEVIFIESILITAENAEG